jgi:hypothetical protein
MRAAVDVLRSSGFEVEEVESAEEAARRIGPSELATVVVGETENVLQPFHQMAPRVRRRVVLVQVGTAVNTADGAAAFVRGVKLLVAATDLGRLGDLVVLALNRHRDLVSMIEPELAR